MNLIIKNYHFMILLFVSFLMSCGSICEMPSKSGEDFGTVYLEKKLNDWMIDLTIDNIQYKNSANLLAVFKIKSKISNSFNDYDLNERKASGDCTIQTKDLIAGQYQYASYNSLAANLNIIYEREKVIPLNYPNNATWRDFDSLTEKITVNIGLDNYYFNLNSDTILHSKPYIKLNNDSFYNVIEMKRLDSITNPLFVRRVYYQKKVGVVCFDFLNGEVWEKQ